MRKFVEPTARNLLRRPLVLGVPFAGLLALSFASLSVFVLGGGRGVANAASLLLGAVGYLGLRIFTRFAKQGWEEAIWFALERRVRPKEATGVLQCRTSSVGVVLPDTLCETDLILAKDGLLSKLLELTPGNRFTVILGITERGARLTEVTTTGRFDARSFGERITELIPSSSKVYSLSQLPVVTDPLWLFGILAKLGPGTQVIASFAGVDSALVKRQIELARRSNAGSGAAGVTDVDSQVSFEEASLVLQGLSRGDEAVVEASLVIASRREQKLDPALFCREKRPELALASALGIRTRFHRSHWVRAVTACDLFPNVFDPEEETGFATLRTVRGFPLYFSPQDPRLEALHWLVVGASGSGKSFLAGLILKRMIEAGAPMSVLFVDHNRSFRRLVRARGEPYLEPDSTTATEQGVACALGHVDAAGRISGVELSDLDLSEKKAAIHTLLSEVQAFLRRRHSVHPLYLVLDECWNFMRDEPVLVQRAFREFRKLNGAVVAITQSLQDFLSDESGQSICQNSPVRVLLRQGEDMSRYQGILGLNAVELARVSRLKQEKGVYSECLIKTPFFSGLGRLCPTPGEHAALRTDNLREELIAEARAATASCKGAC